jgi:hypothetical protein
MDGGIQNLIDFAASEHFTINLSREELRLAQWELQKLPRHFHLLHGLAIQFVAKPCVRVLLYSLFIR